MVGVGWVVNSRQFYLLWRSGAAAVQEQMIWNFHQGITRGLIKLHCLADVVEL